MRIDCPNCARHYLIPDGAIPETGREVQCAACGHVWLAHDRRWHTGASAAIAQQRDAVETIQTNKRLRVKLGSPYHLARVAETCAAAGLSEEAWTWIQRAEDDLAKGLSHVYRAEVMRLKAEVLRHSPDSAPEDALGLLSEADAVAAASGHLAWRWMIAASRAGILRATRGTAAARAELAAALAELKTPGAERHPAYRHARAVMAGLAQP